MRRLIFVLPVPMSQLLGIVCAFANGHNSRIAALDALRLRNLDNELWLRNAETKIGQIDGLLARDVSVKPNLDGREIDNLQQRALDEIYPSDLADLYYKRDVISSRVPPENRPLTPHPHLNEQNQEQPSDNDRWSVQAQSGSPRGQRGSTPGRGSFSRGRGRSLLSQGTSTQSQRSSTPGGPLQAHIQNADFWRSFRQRASSSTGTPGGSPPLQGPATPDRREPKLHSGSSTPGSGTFTPESPGTGDNGQGQRQANTGSNDQQPRESKSHPNERRSLQLSLGLNEALHTRRINPENTASLQTRNFLDTIKMFKRSFSNNLYQQVTNEILIRDPIYMNQKRGTALAKCFGKSCDQPTRDFQGNPLGTTQGNSQGDTQGSAQGGAQVDAQGNTQTITQGNTREIIQGNVQEQTQGNAPEHARGIVALPGVTISFGRSGKRAGRRRRLSTSSSKVNYPSTANRPRPLAYRRHLHPSLDLHKVLWGRDSLAAPDAHERVAGAPSIDSIRLRNIYGLYERSKGEIHNRDLAGTHEKRGNLPAKLKKCVGNCVTQPTADLFANTVGNGHTNGHTNDGGITHGDTPSNDPGDIARNAPSMRGPHDSAQSFTNMRPPRQE